MKIFNNVTELIGKTPLIKLNNYSKEMGLDLPIIAKLEYFNPAGSIKDRVAYNMILDAEKKGLIKSGSVIIEPTSGNTGIGLASVCAARGYRAIFTMPDTMSVERRNLLKAYGAEIVLTDGKKGMSGAIEEAEKLAKETDGSFIPGQFVNPSNPEIHSLTTGPEIWEDTEGKIDVLVAGVGTGGTLTGTGKFLKEKNPDIKVIAVEPYDSPVLSQGKSGSHGIQGIGAGFVPEILDTGLIDEIITVKTEEAYSSAKSVANREGILVGISSGASIFAATLIANKYKDKNIVCILPDSGERYMSTPMFN
ncbi:MAG: cysteine synthase A [Clostridia bacterium]|nr:cysteine synthase A [Clostridia bacterium]